MKVDTVVIRRPGLCVCVVFLLLGVASAAAAQDEARPNGGESLELRPTVVLLRTDGRGAATVTRQLREVLVAARVNVVDVEDTAAASTLAQQHGVNVLTGASAGSGSARRVTLSLRGVDGAELGSARAVVNGADTSGLRRAVRELLDQGRAAMADAREGDGDSDGPRPAGLEGAEIGESAVETANETAPTDDSVNAISQQKPPDGSSRGASAEAGREATEDGAVAEQGGEPEGDVITSAREWGGRRDAELRAAQAWGRAVDRNVASGLELGARLVGGVVLGDPTGFELVAAGTTGPAWGLRAHGGYSWGWVSARAEFGFHRHERMGATGTLAPGNQAAWEVPLGLMVRASWPDPTVGPYVDLGVGVSWWRMPFRADFQQGVQAVDAALSGWVRAAVGARVLGWLDVFAEVAVHASEDLAVGATGPLFNEPLVFLGGGLGVVIPGSVL